MANPRFTTTTLMATQNADDVAITGGTITTSDTTGKVAGNSSAGVYILSTAITANSTLTSVPAGSLGITTNATGLGKLFYADGTKWQFMAIS